MSGAACQPEPSTSAARRHARARTPPASRCGSSGRPIGSVPVLDTLNSGHGARRVHRRPPVPRRRVSHAARRVSVCERVPQRDGRTGGAAAPPYPGHACSSLSRGDGGDPEVQKRMRRTWAEREMKKEAGKQIATDPNPLRHGAGETGVHPALGDLGASADVDNSCV